MQEEDERFADVSRLHVVNLDAVDCGVLVLSILGVQQAGRGGGSLLYMEQLAPSLKKSDCIPNEEHWDGNEESNNDGEDSSPFHHFSPYLTVC